MSEQVQKPKGWYVKNGAFVGWVLVAREGKNGSGLKTHTDAWLPFTHDLKCVTSIKQAGFDEGHEDNTSLYHNGAFIGEINACFDDMVKEWLNAIEQPKELDDPLAAYRTTTP